MREGGRTEYRRKNRRLLLWGGNRMSVDGVDGARKRQQGERMLNGARKRQQGERVLNVARKRQQG